MHKQADGTGHLSYWTSAANRGQGFAQRALRLLCGHAAGEGVTALEAHVAADNIASRAVAAGAGFVQAGEFTDAEGTLMVRYVWTATVVSQPSSRGHEPFG